MRGIQNGLSILSWKQKAVDGLQEAHCKAEVITLSDPLIEHIALDNDRSLIICPPSPRAGKSQIALQQKQTEKLNLRASCNAILVKRFVVNMGQVEVTHKTQSGSLCVP